MWTSNRWCFKQRLWIISHTWNKRYHESGWIYLLIISRNRKYWLKWRYLHKECNFQIDTECYKIMQPNVMFIWIHSKGLANQQEASSRANLAILHLPWRISTRQWSHIQRNSNNYSKRNQRLNLTEITLQSFGCKEHHLTS